MPSARSENPDAMLVILASEKREQCRTSDKKSVKIAELEEEVKRHELVLAEVEQCHQLSDSWRKADMTKRLASMEAEIARLTSLALTIGTETRHDEFSPLLERGSKAPTSVTKRFYSRIDDQKTMGFNLHEGEEPMCKDNKLLHKFKITNLKEAPKGEAEVDLTMALGPDGITVTAKEVGGNNASATFELPFNDLTSPLDQGKVSRLLKEAEEHRPHREAMKALSHAVYIVKDDIDSRKYKDALSEADQQTVRSAVEEAVQWMEGHNTEATTAEELKGKKNAFEAQTKAIMAKVK